MGNFIFVILQSSRGCLEVPALHIVRLEEKMRDRINGGLLRCYESSMVFSFYIEVCNLNTRI